MHLRDGGANLPVGIDFGSSEKVHFWSFEEGWTHLNRNGRKAWRMRKSASKAAEGVTPVLAVRKAGRGAKKNPVETD